MGGAAMVGFLATVAVITYLFAIFAFFVAATSGTDIQYILAGVYGTCGTVAATGAGIIHRIRPQEKQE